MTESRIERTANVGLIALYNADGRLEGWAMSYRNPVQEDALFGGLAEAPRTGVAPISTPASPTATPATTGGLLPDATYEVAQTFVDEYGRETAPSTVASAEITAGLADPVLAPTLLVTPGATGFAGGLLEVWFTWTDADSHETLASPVASTNLPYLAAGTYNQVKVTFPSTPAVAGAAGANVYVRHRSGNTVLAAMLIVDSEDHLHLTDSIMANCSQALPTSNTTGGTGSISITGSAQDGGDLSTASTVRFYIRKNGQTWTDADRRLKLAGVDEWDPATVSYPLLFTGADGELAPGYPPSISQVQAIRQIDLETEVTGLLDEANIDSAIARDSELSSHTDEETLHFTGTEKADCLLSAAEKTDLTDGGTTTLHSHGCGRHSATQATPTAEASQSTDFTIGTLPASGGCSIVRIALAVTQTGTPDYDIEFFSDSGRTVLRYKAESIPDATFEDLIPLEWFGGATIYARLTNNSAADITASTVDVDYRI